MVDQATVAKAIELILHNGLHTYKVQNSKLTVLKDYEQPGKKGAIFVARSKAALTETRGFVITSTEALFENQNRLSHWTPNIFNFGTYTDNRRSHFKGHTEDNLQQINTFVVDLDFHGVKKTPKHDMDFSGAVLGDRFVPTMILETPHGYQIYYVLNEPVYIKRNTQGKLPAVQSAKAITLSLKTVLAKKFATLDVSCNSFGFFRIPRTDNIIFFEPNFIVDFAALQQWSIGVAIENGRRRRLRTLPLIAGRGNKGFKKQINQDWYLAAVQYKNVPEGGKNCGFARHNFVFTLALANYASNVNFEDALDTIDEWNTYNVEPLDNREVEKCVRDAYSGKYQGADKFHIDALVARYNLIQVNKTNGRADRSLWYKFAKPRSERKYSHCHEWQQDLLSYLRRLGKGRDYVETTTRQIRTDLGISAGSLTKAMAELRAAGRLFVEQKKGRHAVTYYTTREMLLTNLIMANRANKLAYLKAIRVLIPEAGVVVQDLTETLANVQIKALDLDLSVFNTA